MPKNDGWKKCFEFTMLLKESDIIWCILWSGGKSTWRNDQLTSIDVAYMNHRKIISLSNNCNSK
jgi:hypothetical protein